MNPTFLWREVDQDLNFIVDRENLQKERDYTGKLRILSSKAVKSLSVSYNIHHVESIEARSSNN